MEIASKYDPKNSEDKWYQYWLDNKLFHSEPDDREPFTVVIPPPNVTGILHMGHILNNSIQDILVRRARMLGKNACWVPGMDHASIATEAKVVNRLKEQGISKEEIGREAFLEKAWEWKEEHGGLILEQLKKLGASCDWDRTRFTMEESLTEAVIDVFIDLFHKGYIYRGERMINWDPKAKTALSDEEVNHKDVSSKLYYINYQIENEQGFITVATTRPETILGDTAVCINPTDDRYKNLKGKRVLVPLLDRSIPIIEDDYVDVEFGTGCLKVTPAHDINDHELGKRHQLEVIDIFNEDATLSEHAELYVGKDRFEVRKEIAKDLEKAGALSKIENIENSIGYSERTNVVVEPRLSKQWFCKMEELAKPALEDVMNDEIQFHPAKFKNTYRHWMENIKDWCVSRQLWWGQRIPAWYNAKDEFVIAKTKEEAVSEFKKKGIVLTDNDIKQDEDVLDTWFSSWLWPISVFDGFHDPKNKDIAYYYPTNDLVTAPDIIFFWVARMIMMGYHYKGVKPFKNVYFTGIVRDKERRKMSKQLGNSPNPLDLIDKYGADAVRVGMLLSAPAGNDLLFDESLCEQGRNFANKIWNAFRLVKGWEVNEDIDQPETAKLAIDWFQEKLNETIQSIDNSYTEFRMSEALMNTYKLIWDEFCSWFLEMVKPAYQSPIDGKTLEAIIDQFENILKLLHPFMPFLTEEIWHLLRDREQSIMIADWPNLESTKADLLSQFEITKEVVGGIRNFRKDKNIANKQALTLFVKPSDAKDSKFDGIICKLTNIEEIDYIKEKKEGAFSFVVRANEYFIPLDGSINVEEEIKKVKKELDYTRGFLISTEKKLSNERFVNNAPEQVVAIEKKKKSDAEARVKALEAQLQNLS